MLTVGDGGIYASALDLYKWEQALNSGKFIKKESLDKVYTPVVLTNGRSRRYGYGWEIGSNSQGKLVYHSGEIAGFRTYIERQLVSGNTVIILTNNSFFPSCPTEKYVGKNSGRQTEFTAGRKVVYAVF